MRDSACFSSAASGTLAVRKPTVHVLAVLTMLATTGCGRRNDHPPTYPVNGTVTLDGEPVSFGGVRFISEIGWLAKSRIQSDGSYTLGTFEDDDGAMAGSYRVSLQVREISVEETSMHHAMLGRSLIPEKYQDAKTSGLEFEVVAGENQFDLELKTE